MNAPIKRKPGPTLFLVDSDPVHKSATCVGCTFARIVESHFVHCEVQNRDGSSRLPPMFKDEDNRGRQIINGHPNQFCPYIHRVMVYKFGRRRVQRTFEQKLRDLSYDRGWVEECPDEGRWYFKKKNWLVTVRWADKSFSFFNLRRQKVAQ